MIHLDSLHLDHLILQSLSASHIFSFRRLQLIVLFIFTPAQPQSCFRLQQTTVFCDRAIETSLVIVTKLEDEINNLLEHLAEKNTSD